MTNEQIQRLFGETSNYADPDAFASDAALSLLDPDDPEQEVDTGLFEQLRILWHVSNDPFRNLLERMELSQSECSRRFCIPLRTVQGWAGETRSAPPYVRLMMAEAVGLLNIRNVPETRRPHRESARTAYRNPSEGEWQTLAHKDASGNWVLNNDPPCE